MKKILTIGIVLFLLSCIMPISPNTASAADGSLIKNAAFSFKSAETPQRLEITFDLAQAINLSDGSSNITYEYFTKNSSGSLVTTNYKKDKTWSGYLNSYDSYPSGEHKYSSGTAGDTTYSDNVPATTIYTSTRTNASIDVAGVDAVKITVLKADGSGESLTVNSDGSTSAVQTISAPIAPVTDVHEDTGIKLDATTGQIPAGAVLVADQVATGTTYDNAKKAVSGAKNIAVYNIKLESAGVVIQPNGNVKISIPVPTNFDISHLSVHKIDGTNITATYPVTVSTTGGIEYATFETNHFSTYVLADSSPETPAAAPAPISDNIVGSTAKDVTPPTGAVQYIYFAIGLIAVSILGIIAFRRNKNENKNK